MPKVHNSRHSAADLEHREQAQESIGSLGEPRLPPPPPAHHHHLLHRPNHYRHRLVPAAVAAIAAAGCRLRGRNLTADCLGTFGTSEYPND